MKFTYDANGGELRRTFPGGAIRTVTRDAASRVTNIVVKNGAGLVSRSVAYSFAQAGADRTLIQNRASTSEQGIFGGAITSYSYDSRNRLTKAKEKYGASGTASWTYGYDAMATAPANGSESVERGVTRGLAARSPAFAVSHESPLIAPA